jgi:hypothetical protein
MGKPGVKLKPEEVEKIWQQYAAGISIKAISRNLNVSHLTIAKYRDQQGWDARRDAIYARASQKVDSQAVNLMAENLKLVRFAKAQLIKEIKEVVDKAGTTSKTPYADLDRIIRLEAFLGGQPDSRPETVTPKDELADKTIEELIIIRKKIVGGNGHRKRITSKVKPGGNGNGNGHKSVHD